MFPQTAVLVTSLAAVATFFGKYARWSLFSPGRSLEGSDARSHAPGFLFCFCFDMFCFVLSDAISVAQVVLVAEKLVLWAETRDDICEEGLHAPLPL